MARGHDVTLFATADSQTRARLHAVSARGYEEDPDIVPKVWEGLHIAELFEHADEFDIIHNNFDFLPLTYSRLISTPELRKAVRFERLNFMDKDYGLTKQVDAIFCRNVLIYFDHPTQKAILNKLCRCLKKGGFFFQGHSESTQGMDLPLKSVAPTIYQRI